VVEVTLNIEDLQIDPEEFQQLFTGQIPFGQEISFYLDESTNQRIKSLWSEGLAVMTVDQDGQKGQQSDIRVLARARQLGSVLITTDMHFKSIHDLIQLTETTTHAGIVLIKSTEAKENPSFVIKHIIQLAESAGFLANALENTLLTI
jgi:predicted nuclease of predicted toxin-antitoxin system